MDGDAKFYNRMEFPVNFRKIWLPGSPPVRLQSGEIIEGPFDLLSQYRFLAPVPFDFHKVESVTQSPTFEYKDQNAAEPTTVKPTEPIIVSAPLVMNAVHEVMEQMTPVHHPTEQEKEIEVKPATDADISLLPFDPATVSWFAVKVDELKKAAEILKIDIKPLEGMPTKKLKWELVKLVKKALNAGN